jgi:hypothetical protein
VLKLILRAGLYLTGAAIMPVIGKHKRAFMTAAARRALEEAARESLLLLKATEHQVRIYNSVTRPQHAESLKLPPPPQVVHLCALLRAGGGIFQALQAPVLESIARRYIRLTAISELETMARRAGARATIERRFALGGTNCAADVLASLLQLLMLLYKLPGLVAHSSGHLTERDVEALTAWANNNARPAAAAALYARVGDPKDAFLTWPVYEALCGALRCEPARAPLRPLHMAFARAG